MTIDPGDYDPRELRELGSEDGPESVIGGNAGGMGSGDALRSSQRETLLMIEDTLEELSTPYLPELPDSYRGELLVLEWLEFLVGKAGRSETIEGLVYYTSIGWITKKVEIHLREYLRGVDPTPETPTPLDQDDHVTSLVYIARLDAMS